MGLCVIDLYYWLAIFRPRIHVHSCRRFYMYIPTFRLNHRPGIGVAKYTKWTIIEDFHDLLQGKSCIGFTRSNFGCSSNLFIYFRHQPPNPTRLGACGWRVEKATSSSWWWGPSAHCDEAGSTSIGRFQIPTRCALFTNNITVVASSRSLPAIGWLTKRALQATRIEWNNDQDSTVMYLVFNIYSQLYKFNRMKCKISYPQQITSY